MKKIVLILLLLLLSNSSFLSQVQSLRKVLFKIDQNSDLKSEINSNVCKEIANEVFDLVFNKSGKLNEVEKLDLIFYMVHYQSKATEIYRTKLDTCFKALKQNSTLYFPICICHYCSLTLASKLIEAEKSGNVKIPTEYSSLIADLRTLIIYDIKKNGQNKKSTKSLSYELTIANFTNSKNFRERIRKYKI